MLLWELVIQTPDVIENLSAAFLLLDGGSRGCPIFQVNQRGEEEEEKKTTKNQKDGKKICVTPVRRYCPWNLPWHGTDYPRQ